VGFWRPGRRYYAYEEVPESNAVTRATALGVVGRVSGELWGRKKGITGKNMFQNISLAVYM
jgi:hypothetical protein